MATNAASSSTFMPLYNPILICMVWTSDLLLTSTIGRKHWGCTFDIRLLWLLYCSLAGSLREAICHVNFHLEGPMARNWGRPPANSQQGTEALCPTLHKELNPANSHLSYSSLPQHVRKQAWEKLVSLCQNKVGLLTSPFSFFCDYSLSQKLFSSQCT